MSGFAISGFLGLPSVRRSPPASYKASLRPWRHSVSCISSKFAAWSQRMRRERALRRTLEFARADARTMADLWAVTLREEQC